jgi:hypothetical protein
VKPVPQDSEYAADNKAYGRRHGDEDSRGPRIQNTKSITGCAQPEATSSDQVKCHSPITAPSTKPALIGLIMTSPSQASHFRHICGGPNKSALSKIKFLQAD